MIFSIFDIGLWYDKAHRNCFDLDKYKQFLDFSKKVGFDYVHVDEKTLPDVVGAIRERSLGVLFCPSYVKKIEEKPDKTFDISFYRNDREHLREDQIEILLEKLKEYCRIAFDHLGCPKDDMIASLNLGCYLESTFCVKNKKEILEGYSIQEHEKMILYFKECLSVLSRYFNKFLYHSQMQGFGAENKVRHELNPIAIAKTVSKTIHNPSNFYYYIPTEFAHDGKYFLDSAISQWYTKREYGLRNAWGAMGVYGFPTTATTAYQYDIDLLHMVVGEKTYGKNRLTYWNFNNVDLGRIEIIKQTIQAIKNDDKEKIVWINRKYSQECSKNSVTGRKIFDEHFGLDGME